VVQPLSINDPGLLENSINRIVKENQTITDLTLESIVDYTPMALQFIPALQGNKTIKRFTITFKFTHPNVVVELAKFIKNDTLEYLQIWLNTSNNTGRTSFEPFCLALNELSNLKVLKFWKMMFPGGDIEFLKNALLRNKSLKELHFVECDMKEEILKSLLAALPQSNLKIMTFNKYAFNITTVGSFLQNDSINNLKLSDYEVQYRR